MGTTIDAVLILSTGAKVVAGGGLKRSTSICSSLIGVISSFFTSGTGEGSLGGETFPEILITDGLLSRCGRGVTFSSWALVGAGAGFFSFPTSSFTCFDFLFRLSNGKLTNL
jgi:hypothetical protein